MKKLLVFTSCVAVVFLLSKVSFAQEAVETETQVLTVETVVAEPEVPPQAQALPFGYPPYPTVGGNPAYGVPYSYPRQPRRFGARLAPRAQYKPYPLPAPGAVPGAFPPVANPAPPMYRGEIPPLQGTLGVPAAAPGTPAAPTVFHRPTPIKNFMSLLTAPRPYIGYNPYGGSLMLTPAPVYQPQQ